MREATALGLVVLLASVALVGCSDAESPAEKSTRGAYEATARRHVKAVRETLDAVNRVKTEADAAAAAETLEGTQKEFEAVLAELKRQPKMTTGQKKAVESIFREAGGRKDASAFKPPKDEWAFRRLAPQLQRTRRALAEAQAQWAEQESGGK